MGTGAGFVILLGLIGASLARADPAGPPRLETLVKQEIFRRAVEEREVMAHAALTELPEFGGAKAPVAVLSPALPGHPPLAGPPPGPWKRYSFYTLFRVGAPVERVRATVTDYRIYSRIIPYIDQADYSPLTHILELRGGIWMFKLHSKVLFEERGERRIHYRIVAGHFGGLSGEIYFESLGERGSLIYFCGEQFGNDWPPQFVIERGAEVVFGFTGQRMRRFIESEETLREPPKPTGLPMARPTASPTERNEKKSHDDQIPQPRNRLFQFGQFGQFGTP